MIRVYFDRARAAVVASIVASVVACGGNNHAVNNDESKSTSQASVTQQRTAPVPEPHFAEGAGQVIEAPVPGAAALAIRVLFYSGSADDPAGKEGLTALTASLMAEGGTKSMTYPEMLKALYPMAARVDAQTDKEQTVFAGLVHPDHLARFVPMFAEVIKEPRFPEADFTRIRQDMVNDIEKRLRATDDENLGKEMLNLMLYPPQHPYGHFVGGTVKGLNAITLDDVKSHAKQVFGKRRMLIGLGGNVDLKAKELLTLALSSLPDGEARLASIPRVEKPAKNEVLIAQKAGKAVAISIGFPHDSRRGTPDFSALALVQSFFGEHRQFHGILMSEMREKRGLNYGDYAYVESFVQEGWSRTVLPNVARRRQHFEIWIRPVDPKDAVFSIRLAMYLLNNLVTNGVTDKNVADTKQFLEGYTRLWDLTPTRRTGYALDEHFYGVSGYLDGYRADLAKLGAEDVNGAINRNLVAWPVKIAIVAPDAEALKAQLVSGAKTEKVYGAAVDPSVTAMDESVSVLPLGITADSVKIVKVEDLFLQ